MGTQTAVRLEAFRLEQADGAVLDGEIRVFVDGVRTTVLGKLPLAAEADPERLAVPGHSRAAFGPYAGTTPALDAAFDETAAFPGRVFD